VLRNPRYYSSYGLCRERIISGEIITNKANILTDKRHNRVKEEWFTVHENIVKKRLLSEILKEL
jgi:hypothetical protein